MMDSQSKVYTKNTHPSPRRCGGPPRNSAPSSNNANLMTFFLKQLKQFSYKQQPHLNLKNLLLALESSRGVRVGDQRVTENIKLILGGSMLMMSVPGRQQTQGRKLKRNSENGFG